MCRQYKIKNQEEAEEAYCRAVDAVMGSVCDSGHVSTPPLSSRVLVAVLQLIYMLKLKTKNMFARFAKAKHT